MSSMNIKHPNKIGYETWPQPPEDPWADQVEILTELVHLQALGTRREVTDEWAIKVAERFLRMKNHG